jgi:hypothetical protein
VIFRPGCWLLVACAVTAAGACGGGTEASWCLSNEDEGWFAGFNTAQCPVGEDERADTPAVSAVPAVPAHDAHESAATGGTLSN